MASAQKIHLGNQTFIGPQEPCFIIAEIGQNHQGDLNIAKQMILQAKESGADCVKFQKTDLPSKFNHQALSRPYKSFNSWGDTYGAHKKFLEFTENDFVTLQNTCRENGILFSSSAMDETSLMFLNSLNVPFIKIGSGDFSNKPLLKKAASLKRPLIVSTGMSDMNEVIDVYRILKNEHLNFCLLHCLSSYPAPLDEINLNVIKTFREIFPDVNIGYSGHETGIDVSVAAVALGAKVLERHFTLNKSWKGSDHSSSLTPSEFKTMVFSIRDFESGSLDAACILDKADVQRALGGYEKKFQTSEIPCHEKLGKSVVAKVRLSHGDVITWENICIKVAEPKGVLAKDVDGIIGKSVNRVVEVDESITPIDVNFHH